MQEISEILPLVRIIGDPILHQAGRPFPKSPTVQEQNALKQQIALAKDILIKTGGAGIAANQCAAIERPYCFAIVGIFYDASEHVAKVTKRYPNAKFPKAFIMVNPVIQALSQETQNFNHACLSVPCGNRCAVKSPMEIEVQYEDPLDNMNTKQENYKGIDAIVLWHELQHILEGKTYIDLTFEALSSKDLSVLHEMLEGELQRRHQMAAEHKEHVPILSVPPFYYSVSIDASGSAHINTKEWKMALENMTEETLLGLCKQASKYL